MTRASSGRVLRPPSGGAFLFDAGSLSLDFVHSGGIGRWAVFESLHEPLDLVRWLAEPPLGLPRELAATEDDLADARSLRHAMSLVVRAVAAGARPPTDAVDAVNAAAASPTLAPQLDPRTGERAWAQPVTVHRALAALARDLVQVLTGPSASRIRECAADDCQLVFVDVSRSGRRRWCAMQRCGNRAKVRTHRSRTADA